MNGFSIICFVLYLSSQCILVNSWENSVPKGPTYFEFSVSDYTKELGYPLEIHEDIQTEDGYLLTMLRVPHGKIKNVKNNQIPKPAVLMLHGLSGNGDIFFIQEEKKNLPFLLANRGYDVWIANARGTKHSRKHVSLDPDHDKAFWDFSQHELGYYDLPAFLLYIKNVTKLEKISCIGHSQGGTILYIMGATRPEFGRFFNLAVALAPAVYFGGEGQGINPIMAPFLFKTLDTLGKSMDLYEFGPQVKSALCDKATSTNESCFKGASVLAKMMQIDFSQYEPQVVHRLLGFIPHSAGMRQFLHYLQMRLRSEFLRYDYGSAGNMQMYGQSTPPIYDLANVNFPSAVFYGNGDYLAAPVNTEKLIRKLGKTVVYVKMVDDHNFSHFDFILSKNVVPLVYKKVINLIDTYSKVPT